MPMTANTATKKDITHRPTRIAVEMAEGRARIHTLDQGRFLGGRVMKIKGNYVRLAIVGIHMPLLGGDTVNIQIKVGEGVMLEVIEPSGMVAYNAEGKRSDWMLNAEVATGATLIWNGKEFVASKGSNSYRSSKIELEADARALFKETLVLGRSGETDVRLNNRTKVFLEGRELLAEELELTPQTRKLPGISGSAKVISTVSALGKRPSDKVSGAQRLDLAGPAVLWRSMASAAHLAKRETEPVFNRWHNDILERGNSDEEADTLKKQQVEFLN